MGLRPGKVTSGEEIAARLQQLDLDILRQKRIVSELERDQHPSMGAKTLLRLLEEARRILAEQMGPPS
jgi:hypothetical protein